jgi:hypothetical protein
MSSAGCNAVGLFLLLYVGHTESHAWVTEDVPSLFHEIPWTIQAVLHELECATLAEVQFSILQPCMLGLLNCLVVFVLMVPHDLLRHWICGSPNGPSAHCMWMGENFSSKIFSSLWCRVCSVRACIIMFKNVFSLDAYHKMHVTVSVVSKCRELHWHIPFWAGNQPVYTPQNRINPFP